MISSDSYLLIRTRREKGSFIEYKFFSHRFNYSALASVNQPFRARYNPNNYS